MSAPTIPTDAELAAYLWPCESRTPRESAERIARANHPRNQTVGSNDTLRREQVAGCTFRRMVAR